ncbi:type VI secretion system baseplate subunit TssF [Bremerella sp. JC817]|uniref:type VI secretion system baseplate subunit TssF n=1 Tax=Bremerella sp. JC817 TaxID=3231756 RepID=UPI0034587561
MSDELLEFYRRERAYLLDQGKSFAEANPKIASRLGLGGDDFKDPHVGRLIESFAYLNARTRLKLEDDFPEIAASMLEVLFPHLLRPIPSMSIVQFGLDRAQVEAFDGFTVARGTSLETEQIDGDPCRFRTCYPVTCWPIEITDVRMMSHPFEAPATAYNTDSTAMIRIRAKTFSTNTQLNQLNLKTLRFYIKEQAPYKYDLYELLMTSVVGVAAARNPKAPDCQLLGTRCIEPVGFQRDEGMFDYPARSFIGYRMLTEFFTFPDKFLFFDLQLGNCLKKISGEEVEFYIFLKETNADLERRLSAENLRIGCTPITNLYRQEAEPIRLTHQQTEYHVIPDSRRPFANEIYSIDEVTAVSQDNREVPYHPFYSFKHASQSREAGTYWHATRRPNPGGREVNDEGTELFMSIVDLDFQPSSPAQWSLHAELTCFNRDLPERLPFGGDQPKLYMSGLAPVTKIRCLLPPTPTRRPDIEQGIRWRLISHLSLNHLSLIEDEEGSHALREILSLYDYVNSNVSQAFVEGIKGIEGEPCTARVKTPNGTVFCRGTRVHLTFDSSRFSGGGMFLMASVLERFFALYCTINSFTQTVIHDETGKEIHRWAPRAGENVLL